MNLTQNIDCSRCPKLCCHSLKREGPGFADPSKTARMCTHCDVASSTGCKIHNVLEFRSRVCASYTCHGVGMYISALFDLPVNQLPPRHIQATFRERQGIAFYLAQLAIFFEKHADCEQIMPLQQFCALWEERVTTSRDIADITIQEFVTKLNQFMRECQV